MITAIVVVASGIAVVIVGVLARHGRLPRNHFAGVRTRATMHSDQAFRAGNRAIGPWAITGGAMAIMFGVAALPMPVLAATLCAFAGMVAMLAMILLGTVQANRAARQATQDESAR